MELGSIVVAQVHKDVSAEQLKPDVTVAHRRRQAQHDSEMADRISD
jgi:hypothetical protein